MAPSGPRARTSRNALRPFRYCRFCQLEGSVELEVEREDIVHRLRDASIMNGCEAAGLQRREHQLRQHGDAFDDLAVPDLAGDRDQTADDDLALDSRGARLAGVSGRCPRDLLRTRHAWAEGQG